jgi:hypothetical protein
VNHLRNKIQKLVPILIASTLGRADDGNGATVHIPIPGEAVPAGEFLHLPKGSCLHVTDDADVDYLLRADFALKVGLALEGRREPLITAVPKGDIAYVMKLIVEDVDGFSGFEGGGDGIGRRDGGEDLANEVLALIVGEVLVLVVLGVLADEVVGAQVGDADHQSHAVVIVLIECSRRLAPQLTPEQIGNAALEFVVVF